MMSATVALTFCAPESRDANTRAKALSKPAWPVEILVGMHNPAETLDERIDLLASCLERGAVDDQARRNPGDDIDFLEPVGLERFTARYQIDDAWRQLELGRQFHGAAQADAFG